MKKRVRIYRIMSGNTRLSFFMDELTAQRYIFHCKHKGPLSIKKGFYTYLAAVMLLFVVCSGSFAQTIKQDAQGNYVQVSAAKVPAVSTGKFFITAKGERFNVYKSAKGRLFVLRVSAKTGKEYKQYLN